MWWHDFFDDEYLDVWGELFSDAETGNDVDVLADLLALGQGARVLDAPCGYGRHSRAFAEKGFHVVGVDQSSTLLGHAQGLGDGAGKISYLQADLRAALPGLEPDSFDGAVNLFSSVGYGGDDDDRAIFGNIASLLKPRAKLFVDTMHRDAIVIRLDRGQLGGKSLASGTDIIETPRFDPVEGRIYTTWSWSGGGRSGSKSAEIRVYSITELVTLVTECGFTLVSLHRGIDQRAFVVPDHLSKRIGLLFERDTSAPARG